MSDTFQIQSLPTREIIEITRSHGAISVSVFGSRSRGDADPGSDLDLLVAVVSGTTLLDLIRMKAALEESLELDVDIVTVGGLHPRLKKEILEEAKPLHGAA